MTGSLGGTSTDHGARGSGRGRRQAARTWLARVFPPGGNLPHDEWRHHHGFVLRTLAVLVVAVPAYGFLAGGEPAHTAAHAAPLLLLTLLARTTALPRNWRAGSAALGLMAASALVVHISGGRTEAHFLFFALLPLAALYAARTPFLLAVGFVAVHHFVLGSLAPSSVFERDEPALGLAALHAAFVLVESWACLVTWRRFEDRREIVERLVRERTAQLRQQRDESARLAAVVQSTDDAVLTMTPQGRILTWNPGAERLYGHREAEVVGRDAGLLLPAGPEGGPADDLAADLAALARTGSLDVLRLHRRRDGSLFEARVTLSAIPGVDGVPTGVAAIARDVSALRRSEAEALATARQLQEQAAELTRLALHDPLTGLANRTLMQDRLEHALATRRARRNAVLVLDLDDFKAVNDVFGHGAGDAVLIEVARRLECCVRPADTVARLGGDEFVVLMEDAGGRRDVEAVADRLLAALCRPVPWGTERFVVGGSIGITLTDLADGRNPTELLRDADIAMYVAKSGGKNNHRVFEAGMRERVVAHNELVRDLRDAVAAGELRLFYQPQVDLRSGRVTGVEALARWQHGDRGLVPPAEFIAAAESTGIITDIDDWALGEACEQLRAWDQAGLPPLRVAVNVSAGRLTTGDLAGAIEARARRAGVDPARLEIEVTETAAVGPGTGAAESLRRVRDLGVHVAIDDFGMGHSSLSRLQEFPLDRLKIDRSFIAPLSAGTPQGSIADAMIALGRSLGLEVVAEGVEAAEQLTALRALGCPAAQGYLFGRPVPPGDIAALVRAERPVTVAAAG